MSKPQQPELGRSERGATDSGSAKAKADHTLGGDEAKDWVPPDNRPGHHPEHDQDKPEGPPPSAE
jgi:hypothetical protein